MLTEFAKFLSGLSETGHIEATSSNPLLHPSDMKLTSLEEFSTCRYRERYEMNTTSINAFIEYTNSKKVVDKDAIITSVDPIRCTARAIFNAVDGDGDPGHCDDTAHCSLLMLPAYRFLCSIGGCLLYTSPSPRDRQKSRMPSSA